MEAEEMDLYFSKDICAQVNITNPIVTGTRLSDFKSGTIIHTHKSSIAAPGILKRSDERGVITG